MGLRDFMARAYGERIRSRRLETRKGDQILSLEDLAESLGEHPSKDDVAVAMPEESAILARILGQPPEDRSLQILWGHITSLAAERSHQPMNIPGGDYAGLEMSRGHLILGEAGDHVGEGLKGGRITVGSAGDYLGQGMVSGGIVAGACKKYAFRNARGGWGVVLGHAGDYIGLGNSGARLLVKGSAGIRAGWLMSGGRLTILGDAGDYLGLMMKSGDIVVRGRSGARSGWQLRGGRITLGEVAKGR